MTHRQLFHALEKPHSALTRILMGDSKRFTPAERSRIENCEELLNDLRTQLAQAPPQEQCPECRARLGLPSEVEIAAMTETQVLALLFGKSKPNRRRK